VSGQRGSGRGRNVAGYNPAMSRPLLLFDIDGTLLEAGSAGRAAFDAAAKRLFGDHFHFDGIQFGGHLDPLIFAEAARRHRLDDHRTHHDRFRDTYFTELEARLNRDTGGDGSPRAMPGVLELLTLLRAADTVTVGLLTGNYGHSARLKLRAVGIEPDWFTITAFGDDAPSRPDLVALAMDRHARDCGGACAPERVVVIGDTPRDVACAKAHGCVAFAVATGSFDAEALQSAGADHVVETLEDPSPLLTLCGLSNA
jgi:phosphoglycolate phosphatase